MNTHPLSDLRNVIKSFADALPLLWKNQLWKGYFSHGPVSYLSILLVLVISYKTYSFFNPKPIDNLKSEVKQTALKTIKDIAKSELGDSITDSIAVTLQKEGLVNKKVTLQKDSLSKGVVHIEVEDTSAIVPQEADKDTSEEAVVNTEPDSLTGSEEPSKEENKNDKKDKATGHVDEKSLFSGGSKYLSIILLNMLIAHFCGRVIGMMGGFEKKIGLKSYFKSQIRVLQVGILNWALEIALGVLISIVCGMFFNDGFEKAGKLLLQMFFLGYLFFDSYNDYFDLKIKESRLSIINHVLPATLAGAIAFLLMSIPYVGSIVGPIVCSVAVTIFLAREKGLYLKSATV